ncbi:MAG: YcgN family cysteine cluster protein [Methylococcales bacterium]|nr:MAG: YcgN family cysteine cluster protein [Methylococcales bacterium]
MNFWETKNLSEMSTEEWESLCDNCGKCCLHKLEDEQTGEIVFTNVACKLLKLKTCRCSSYHKRTQLVPACLDLKRLDFTKYDWLPATCAYRLLNNNETLPRWHPLISGSTDSVKRAGISISSYAIEEALATNLENHIIKWLD